MDPHEFYLGVNSPLQSRIEHHLHLAAVVLADHRVAAKHFLSVAYTPAYRSIVGEDLTKMQGQYLLFPGNEIGCIESYCGGMELNSTQNVSFCYGASE